MKFVRGVLVLGGLATLLAGCGQPVCIAGIGNCDAYKRDTGGATGSNTRVIYTLTMNPKTIAVGATATASLTSNSTKSTTGASCEWLANTTGSVGGNVSPDANPMTTGAICTAGFTATQAGQVILQVKEKSSGVSTQTQFTVTP